MTVITSADDEYGAAARRLLKRATVVDMIAPESPAGGLGATGAFEKFIAAYQRAGVHWASLTIEVGYPSIEWAIKMIARTRQYVRENADRFILLDHVADAERAKVEGKIALNFNFQTTDPLLQDVAMVEVYRRLGIGHMLLAYNARNFVADGCHEPSNTGLSRFGREVVQEMNRVGMIVDVSHTGYRSSMDAIVASDSPVVFSHSNPAAVHGHERNIRDDQIKAAAATGGLVGIAGAGLFLGPDASNISADLIFRHLDHVVQLVGPEHAGLGLDYIANLEDLRKFADENREKYAGDQGYFDQDWDFASPEVIPDLVILMLRAGYRDADVLAILGENWIRVCNQVWR